jgi:hypothetical protein
MRRMSSGSTEPDLAKTPAKPHIDDYDMLA